MKFYITSVLLILAIQSYSQAESSSNVPLIDSIGMELSLDAVTLDSMTWKIMGLESIEIFNPSFEYSIIYLSSHKNYQIALIQRAYSEENYHWACTLTKDGQLIDWLTTAYDNSEGFLTIKSIIGDDRIQLNKWNVYSDPEELNQTFSILENGSIQAF